MPTDYTSTFIESGENNRILNNSIGVNNPSANKISIVENIGRRDITDIIFDDEFFDKGYNIENNILLGC